MGKAENSLYFLLFLSHQGGAQNAHSTRRYTFTTTTHPSCRLLRWQNVQAALDVAHYKMHCRRRECHRHGLDAAGADSGTEKAGAGGAGQGDFAKRPQLDRAGRGGNFLENRPIIMRRQTLRDPSTSMAGPPAQRYLACQPRAPGDRQSSGTARVAAACPGTPRAGWGQAGPTQSRTRSRCGTSASAAAPTPSPRMAPRRLGRARSLRGRRRQNRSG